MRVSIAIESDKDVRVRTLIADEHAHEGTDEHVRAVTFVVLNAALAAECERADAAVAKLDAALAVCAAGEHQATRWEDPFPVPAWVTDVRAALQGGQPAAPTSRDTPEADRG